LTCLQTKNQEPRTKNIGRIMYGRMIKKARCNRPIILPIIILPIPQPRFAATEFRVEPGNEPTSSGRLSRLGKG
jgi:hypothetical protein